MPELYTAPSVSSGSTGRTSVQVLMLQLYGDAADATTPSNIQMIISTDLLTPPSLLSSLPPPPHGANFWMWKTAQAAPCQRSVMLPDTLSGEKRWLLRLKMMCFFFFFRKTGQPQAAVGRWWHKTSEYESRKSNHDLCGERTALLALPRMRNEIKSFETFWG